MSVLAVLLAVAVLAVVVFVVSAPLRTARAAQDAAVAPDAQEHLSTQHELEVAREAKYREIRDAELDYRTGKLSREDYDAVDGALRAEAVEILDRLEDSERG